jgi:hypothetical protein
LSGFLQAFGGSIRTNWTRLGDGSSTWAVEALGTDSRISHCFIRAVVASQTLATACSIGSTCDRSVSSLWAMFLSCRYRPNSAEVSWVAVSSDCGGSLRTDISSRLCQYACTSVSGSPHSVVASNGARNHLGGTTRAVVAWVTAITSDVSGIVGPLLLEVVRPVRDTNL